MHRNEKYIKFLRIIRQVALGSEECIVRDYTEVTLVIETISETIVSIDRNRFPFAKADDFFVEDALNYLYKHGHILWRKRLERSFKVIYIIRGNAQAIILPISKAA